MAARLMVMSCGGGEGGRPTCQPPATRGLVAEPRHAAPPADPTIHLVGDQLHRAAVRVRPAGSRHVIDRCWAAGEVEMRRGRWCAAIESPPCRTKRAFRVQMFDARPARSEGI
jgi:hypothetical protein